MLKKSMICNIQESIILVMRKSMIKIMKELSRLLMIKYINEQEEVTLIKKYQ